MILKKWTLSRCLSQAAGETPAGDDAAKTAAAYLEMGNAGIEVYEKLDALAKGFLARTYTGSVKSQYDTMKCIDLFESEELDRIAKDAARP
jgi:Type VI secretion system (T6SS), amidase immunity protein